MLKRLLPVFALLLTHTASFAGQAQSSHHGQCVYRHGGYGGGGMPMAQPGPGSGTTFMGYTSNQIPAYRLAPPRLAPKPVRPKTPTLASLPAHVDPFKCNPETEQKNKQWNDEQDKKIADAQAVVDGAYKHEFEKSQGMATAIERQAQEKDVSLDTRRDIESFNQSVNDTYKTLHSPQDGLHHHLNFHIDKTARAFIKDELSRLQNKVLIALENFTPDSASAAGRVVGYASAKAQAIHEFVAGVAQGVYKGSYDTTATILAIYKHPSLVGYIGQSIMQNVTDPSAFFNHTKGAFLNFYRVQAYGLPGEKGQAIGRLVSDLFVAGVLGKVAAPLQYEIKLIANEIAIGQTLGPAVLKRVLPELEIPLRTDLEAVKKTVIAERQVLKGWDKGYTLTGWRDANSVNAELERVYGMQPPWLKESQVIDFVTQQPMTEFVRIHVGNNRIGGWVVEKTGIEGLNPYQIQLKYSLPEIPTFVTEVHVPRGTQMSRGRVAFLDLGEKLSHVALDVQHELEGAVQYRIENPHPAWFKNSRKLGDLQ